jgi:protein TonB
MTVSIKSDGTLEKIEIRRSSGHAILDAAAKKIVEMGAPYAPFSDNMLKEADVIDITRTWTFTKDDSLKTNATE